MKFLIVNADDFGMTSAVSRGILEAAAGGLVRAASAMANAPEFEASMEMLSASGVDLDMGLHATLTWGRPLLDPHEIPTLVDAQGSFLSRKNFFLRCLSGGVSVDEAYRETKAQMERLLAHRPTITHLDGHHHVHVFPTISLAAERIAEKYRIPFVRAPHEGWWNPPQHAFFQRAFVSCLPASGPEFWRRRGLRSTDFFAGFSLGAGPRLRERWMEVLKRLPHGTTEIMVHPGYASGAGDTCDESREQEIAVLGDPELLKAVRDHGIEVLAFRDLSPIAPGGITRPS